MEILIIIPIICLGVICLMQLSTIERQKKEIEAGEQAFKLIAKKYRELKNV